MNKKIIYFTEHFGEAVEGMDDKHAGQFIKILCMTPLPTHHFLSRKLRKRQHKRGKTTKSKSERPP